MGTIGFIGVGNMGGALARAASKSNHGIYITNRSVEKAEALAKQIGATIATKQEICEECDLIFLGVKPQGLSELAEEINPYLSTRKGDFCLVSMAAATSTQRLEELFGKYPIIRIMPNTPVGVGHGVVQLTRGSLASDKHVELLRETLEYAGIVDEIDEDKIDAASVVSGCGPAFVYMFMESMARAGVECGLTYEKALTYAANTLMGAAALQIQTGKSPDTLKKEVCSPKGTTIEGVMSLDSSDFDKNVSDAVKSSYRRTLEIASGQK